MFSYFAYGLGLHSEIPIPEFIADTVPADVTLRIDTQGKFTDYLPEKALAETWALQVNRERAIVYVRDTGLYLIERGTEIVFLPAAEATQAIIRFYLVGTIMAIVLYQRQFLVLHGSVIAMGGSAVLFLGNSGDGKSSTAAALHAAGYRLVNDDVAPITLSDRPALLEPGFPQIKLSEATARVLNYDFAALPLLHGDSHKRGYRPQGDFDRSPLNIGRIYVLSYGEDFASTPIASSLATMELSRHSRPTTLYQQGDAQHFFQCTNLVREQTIYRLQRPKNLTLLPQIVSFIEQDLALST
ncbi:MAG: hypothetical protein AAFQ41_05565 [Cyanobacteria bacterium J06623_7]